MAKKNRNKPDFNQIARRIVDQATGENQRAPKAKKKAEKQKDPAAVALGRRSRIMCYIRMKNRRFTNLTNAFSKKGDQSGLLLHVPALDRS